MKRFLTKWRWVLVAAVIALLVAVVLITLGKTKQGVSVTFLDFTNHQFNGRMAWFVLTNERNRTIQYAVSEAQLRSNGVWFFPEHNSGVAIIRRTEWHWKNGNLVAGGWTNVAAVVPPESSVWRIRVVSWDPGRLHWLASCLRANIEAYRKGLPLPGFKPPYLTYEQLRVQTDYSREITNEFEASASSLEVR